MPSPRTARKKSTPGNAAKKRAPAREAAKNIALVLQGGGALGAYQVGVYQGLHEAGIVPDWIAGISIGAFNTALIAGNPPERRMQAWGNSGKPFPSPTCCLRPRWGRSLS